MPAAETSPLTVGLLGLGVIGQVHLRTLAARSDVSVVLAADPSPSARERCGVPAYDRLDAVLADLRTGRVQAPDLFVLATPTSTHLDLVQRLLDETGADVLSEKPLTEDPVALDALGSRSDAAARVRVVNHFAFSPEVEWGVGLVAARGWGEPAIVLSTFNDPYVAMPPARRASYVSTWVDSGPNQLGMLERFVTGCEVRAHSAAPDGSRSVTEVGFATGAGVLCANWHTGDSSKQTTMRWEGGREVLLDHTAMTGLALDGGSPVEHLGHDGSVDRKTAHYRAMYDTYLRDRDHPLLSLAHARTAAAVLRQAGDAPPVASLGWQ
ncbi:Gfo/Idh/MocA family oxidoreductase [Nocardioides sp. STR2]|uniref:Gfo/Idh/MocA family oxidoreductase n=1 Tax=Nocardioides pini TaxID=2975053 RepID=A0ABT4CGN5_9ACTN|nr:Gfo/Idh/MocA family oxidoreductase [Nocardioides pini]MCY4728100.1 Gfo/Idh/MocA family oxidoreductase [Nocardioides pini]